MLTRLSYLDTWAAALNRNALLRRRPARHRSSWSQSREMLRQGGHKCSARTDYIVTPASNKKVNSSSVRLSSSGPGGILQMVRHPSGGHWETATAFNTLLKSMNFQILYHFTVV